MLYAITIRMESKSFRVGTRRIEVRAQAVLVKDSAIFARYAVIMECKHEK